MSGESHYSRVITCQWDEDLRVESELLQLLEGCGERTRLCFTASGMATKRIFKRQTVAGAGEDGEGREARAVPVGMRNGPVAVQNGTAAPPEKGTRRSHAIQQVRPPVCARGDRSGVSRTCLHAHAHRSSTHNSQAPGAAQGPAMGEKLSGVQKRRKRSITQPPGARRGYKDEPQGCRAKGSEPDTAGRYRVIPPPGGPQSTHIHRDGK